MIKIVDCFTVCNCNCDCDSVCNCNCNILDLLNYRLNILNEVVDYFVIVNSNSKSNSNSNSNSKSNSKSNSNSNSKSNSKSNLETHIKNKLKSEKFNEKIIYIDNESQNEIIQQNAISFGIEKINNLNENDVLIISKLNEVPDPNTLLKIKQGHYKIEINILGMEMYYKNLNTKLLKNWYGTKTISYKNYFKLKSELNLNCNDIRNIQCYIIQNGGWYLSHFDKETNLKNELISDINYGIHVSINDNNYLPIDYDKYLQLYYKL
jgi:beta-1,4-mannosyl-glycoprotein beta-1,4-N-acetylglucosaminyltransferase